MTELQELRRLLRRAARHNGPLIHRCEMTRHYRLGPWCIERTTVRTDRYRG